MHMQSFPQHNHAHIARPWRETVRRLRRFSIRGLRHLQFTSLLLTRSYWGLILALNWWDIIDEHIFLGGTLMFDDLERLHGQGVQAVVNLCAERRDNQTKLHEAGIDYLWLPVFDSFPPSLEQIVQGLTWLDDQIQARRTVYIHCAVGVGRSATLLACWYIYAKGMTVPHVLRFLKTRRPQVTLTRRQLRRIREFEHLLLLNTGKLSGDWRYDVAWRGMDVH